LNSSVMPRGVNPVGTAVHADSLGKETCTALFRQAKIMQKLPGHCSLKNNRCAEAYKEVW